MNVQELQERRLALEQASSVQDLPSYAEEWNRLAADFEAAGCPAAAEACRQRWQHYRDQDLNGYAQLVGVTAATEGVG